MKFVTLNDFVENGTGESGYILIQHTPNHIIRVKETDTGLYLCRILRKTQGGFRETMISDMTFDLNRVIGWVKEMLGCDDESLIGMDKPLKREIKPIITDSDIVNMVGV